LRFRFWSYPFNYVRHVLNASPVSIWDVQEFAFQRVQGTALTVQPKFHIVNGMTSNTLGGGVSGSSSADLESSYGMITYNVSPEPVLGVNALARAGVNHELAPAVMEAVRKHGPGPVQLWRVVNALADAQQPNSRARRRFWRRSLLPAITELTRAGVLFRQGPLISLSDFMTSLRPRSRTDARLIGRPRTYRGPAT
jgi:hypothetical protein